MLRLSNILGGGAAATLGAALLYTLKLIWGAYSVWREDHDGRSRDNPNPIPSGRLVDRAAEVTILVQTLQAMQAENRRLNSRIEDLEGVIEKLERRLRHTEEELNGLRRGKFNTGNG